jgi:hypothetical protein
MSAAQFRAVEELDKALPNLHRVVTIRAEGPCSHPFMPGVSKLSEHGHGACWPRTPQLPLCQPHP